MSTELEKALHDKRSAIAAHQADLRETATVRERLHMADKYTPHRRRAARGRPRVPAETARVGQLRRRPSVQDQGFVTPPRSKMGRERARARGQKALSSLDVRQVPT